MLLNHASCSVAAETFELGQAPTTKEAQAIADELYSEFVSEEVDKVGVALASNHC